MVIATKKKFVLAFILFTKFTHRKNKGIEALTISEEATA